MTDGQVQTPDSPTVEGGQIAPCGLITISPEGRIKAMNAMASEWLGRDTLVGEALDRILDDDHPVFEVIALCHAPGARAASYGVRLTGHGLKTERVDLHAHHVGDGCVCLAIVRSGREEVGLRGIAEFAKVFGHELKTPLAGISGAAQLLRRAMPDTDASTLRLLALIRSETERLARTVSRYADLEALSRPRMAPFNVHELIDRVIDSERIAMAYAGVIERDFDPSLPPLVADSDHVHHAVSNLVRNAIEAPERNERDKRIRVTTRIDFSHRLAGQLKMGAISVRVANTGAPITDDVRARLSEPFATEKPGGSGIGLAIVRDVMRAHNGDVDISDRDGWTAFLLRFPMSARTHEKDPDT